MKKIILSSLIGLMVVGSAMALPTVDNRRAACEKQPDKYVWVTKNETCIPISPCKSDYEIIKQTYCYKIFQEIQLESIGQAKRLISKYLDKYGLKCTKYDAPDPGVLGQDYVRCHVDDGNYMEFEFDDLNERNAHTSLYGMAKGLCLIVNGQPKLLTKPFSEGGPYLFPTTLGKSALTELGIVDPYTDRYFLACEGISEKVCMEIYENEAGYYKKVCYPKKLFIE